MTGTSEYRPNGRGATVTTPEELVLHLCQAGAKGVYLSRTDAFRDGVVPIIATYTPTPAETVLDVDPKTVRELLQSVFESIDNRIRFHGRECALEWTVEPEFTGPRTDLVPLYDRDVEQKYGDGFNLWNLFFVYEERQESNSDR
ncbi:hypothetical protein [Natrinema salinisoli]|uniref:hypothetical protein n=1 Tax=Natrinema salinisoli TaxID=2878535 RepID=UPI001CEFE441|nr:hypothetical protein [Natrinema salinisoli]